MAKRGEKNAFSLLPAGDDVYVIVRVPKDKIKPGMSIGQITFLPADPVLGCYCDGWCCDNLSIL